MPTKAEIAAARAKCRKNPPKKKPKKGRKKQDRPSHSKAEKKKISKGVSKFNKCVKKALRVADENNLTVKIIGKKKRRLVLREKKSSTQKSNKKKGMSDAQMMANVAKTQSDFKKKKAKPKAKPKKTKKVKSNETDLSPFGASMMRQARNSVPKGASYTTFTADETNRVTKMKKVEEPAIMRIFDRKTAYMRQEKDEEYFRAHREQDYPMEGAEKWMDFSRWGTYKGDQKGTRAMTKYYGIKAAEKVRTEVITQGLNWY